MTKVTQISFDDDGGPGRRRIHLREISGDSESPGRLAMNSAASLIEFSIRPFAYPGWVLKPWNVMVIASAEKLSNSISPNSPIHLPGLAFVLSAVLLAIGSVIAWRITRHTVDLATTGDTAPQSTELSSVVPVPPPATTTEPSEHSP